MIFLTVLAILVYLDDWDQRWVNRNIDNKYDWNSDQFWCEIQTSYKLRAQAIINIDKMNNSKLIMK